MRSIVTGGVALAGAGLLTATLYAANGIQVSVKTTNSEGTTETSQVQLDANHMRAESAGMRGGKSILIFDGSKQVMDIVNLDSKTYNEITKADVDKLAAQMSDAMSRMNQAMANMPPEQRAQMEAMMRGRMSQMGGSAAAAPKIEYRKTGADKVGKWSCEKYEGYRGGQKVSELCTVDPSVLGFTASDFAVTQEMQNFFSKLMPQQADHVFALGSTSQGYSGVPIRSIFYAGGSQTTMEVTDIGRQNLPDSTFQVPAGFQKQPFGPMGRGR